MKEQLRRRAGSIALIIGFFLFWEFACVAFGIRDLVLPRPSQIILTLIDRMPAITRRRAIHRGVGREGSMPVTVSATNSGQAGSSSTTG